MKTKVLFIILFVILGLSSFSQKKDQLVKEKTKSLIFLKDKNWDNTFKPSIVDVSNNLKGMAIDTVKIYSIVRDEISPDKYKKLGTILTKLSSSGQIVSVAFAFRGEEGIDIDKYTIISERIKKEVKWNLQFSRKVDSEFYLFLSVPAPRGTKKIGF